MSDPPLAPLPFPLTRLTEAQLACVDSALTKWCDRYNLVNSLQVNVARVFMQHCSPRGANDTGLDLATDYLLWFFALDDMPEGQQKHEVLTAVRAIIGGSVAPKSSIDRATHDLCTKMREQLSGLETTRLFDFMDALITSFIWETERAERMPPIDLYRKNREHTIAVYPYLEMFRLTAGASPSEEEWPKIRELERLCVVGVYLTNDILSVKRDLKKSNHNLVLAIIEELGVAYSESLHRVSVMLEQSITDFLALRAAVLGRAGLSATVIDYIEYLGTMIEGNRAATLLCAQRFLDGA